MMADTGFPFDPEMLKVSRWRAKVVVGFHSPEDWLD